MNIKNLERSTVVKKTRRNVLKLTGTLPLIGVAAVADGLASESKAKYGSGSHIRQLLDGLKLQFGNDFQVTEIKLSKSSYDKYEESLYSNRLVSERPPRGWSDEITYQHREHQLRITRDETTNN